jgi:hypothetical protein
VKSEVHHAQCLLNCLKFAQAFSFNKFLVRPDMVGRSTISSPTLVEFKDFSASKLVLKSRTDIIPTGGLPVFNFWSVGGAH